MNRTERRAAERKALKLARRAGFPLPETPTPAAPQPAPIAPPRASDFRVITPKSPISDAKLAANRANAQHSTGAKTEAGRAASSQNRTTHGLARHNGVFRILPNEDAAGFEALKAGLIAEHQPTTTTEAILINTMAESHWLAQRAQSFVNCTCDFETGLIAHPDRFTLYQRYQTTHTRAFHKALTDLLKLRAEKRKEASGFEAQTRKQEELRIKNEKHEIKKEAHYWDVLRKDAAACNQIAANTTQQIKALKEDPGFEAQYHAELAKHGLQPNSLRMATAKAGA
jgi:hypothetical protein